MDKKECKQIIDNLPKLIQYGYGCSDYEFEQAISCVDELYQKLYDPQHYEFEDLKPDMWVWIEYYKEIGKRGRMTHIKKTYYSEGKPTVMCCEYDSSFSCSFDFYKFYPVTRSFKYANKTKIKLSKLEYEMILSYSENNDNSKFNSFSILRKLKEKGYFKEVDENLTLKEIKERAVIVDE